MATYLDDFEEYIKKMNEIRLLSKPDLGEIGDSKEYSKTLIRNFSKIGDLAKYNRTILDKHVNPILSGQEALDAQTREKLEKFNELLLESKMFEETDAHLAEVLNDLLFEEMEIGEDSSENDRVISTAEKVQRDYLIIAELTRFINDDTEAIRAKAIENHAMLESFLEPEVFSRLSDEAKGAALHSSLSGALLYESTLVPMPESYWDECYAILERGKKRLNDPFYREAFPDYAWESFEFRILYYGSFQAYSILPERIAKKAYQYAQDAIKFLENCKNEAILAAVSVDQEKDLADLASVQAGYTPAREACEAFYKAYLERDINDYSIAGVNKNLDSASSYLSTAKLMNMEMTEADYDRVFGIQKSMLDYLYRIPNTGDVYLRCMTLFSNLPIFFQEVPGAMTMEEFCVNAFAAIHPPTYVHVNMVARFAECMARHLLKFDPAIFVGFPGCPDVESVKASKERIIEYTYHAALCHDLGKLFIIDTISMYGRKLLETEFVTIKNHPGVGANLAAEHLSTREYADVIRGHHIWYDCSRGYPANFDTRKSPYKSVIDIVMVADCLDAATDTVGRSYSRGKTFEEFESEIVEGAGTHYAPFFVELFKQPALRADIEYLLSEGREKLYQDTYNLIKKHEIIT